MGGFGGFGLERALGFQIVWGSRRSGAGLEVCWCLLCFCSLLGGRGERSGVLAAKNIASSSPQPPSLGLGVWGFRFLGLGFRV